MRGNSLIRNWAKIFVLISFAALSGCAGKPLATTDPWGTQLFNDARTNRTDADVTVPLALSWDKDLSEFRLLRPFTREELSTPALSDGLLYIGSTSDRFYAVDLSKGRVKWKFNARHPLEAAPAITDGMVCFGSSDGVMRCFDAAGKLLWQFQARSEILSSPIVKDGQLYFNSSDDRAYALDAKTGERLWTYNRGTFKAVSPRIYGSPAYSNGRLYFLFSDGVVVSIEASTGREVWSKKVISDFSQAGRWRRTPLVENGSVYVIDGNGAVVALSEESGEVKGIFNLIKARDFILPDSRSIVIAGESQLVAVDRLSGAILWKKDVATGTLSSIFASGDKLFVLSNFKKTPLGIDFLARYKGHVEALNIKDGTTAWTTKLGSSITANASSAYSRVALLSDKGEITVFEPK